MPRRHRRLRAAARRMLRARARACNDLPLREPRPGGGGTLDLVEFSGDAGVAAAWTRGVLSERSLEWLNTLEPHGSAHDVALFHGSARDPVWEYVLTSEAALATLLLTEEQIVLVGHSHAALHVALRGSELEGAASPDGTCSASARRGGC